MSAISVDPRRMIKRDHRNLLFLFRFVEETIVPISNSNELTGARYNGAT